MADSPKSFQLGAEIHAYIVAHGTPPDAIQLELIEETRKLGGISLMQIAPEQGAFMTLLTRLIGARRAIEVGTFTGYSSLCIARGMGPAGRLIACDVSTDWTATARRYWEKAGIAGQIDLRIGPATETLAALPKDPVFDLAFIDADKTNYHAYYELILERLRPGGVILVDNVLWMGNVVNAEATDPNTLAIRKFNDAVASDARVDCSMIAVGDGLTLLRKR
jgi:caffeoyl-CoA O-methyltransferase